MSQHILMLEDCRERVAAFRSCLDQHDYELQVWRSAHSMVADLPENLLQATLICLDHDLIAEPGEPDLGDGLQVAEAIAAHPAVCPVVIHSTNVNRVYTMLRVLGDGGWETHRVAPIAFGTEWIPQIWYPTIRPLFER